MVAFNMAALLWTAPSWVQRQGYRGFVDEITVHNVIRVRMCYYMTIPLIMTLFMTVTINQIHWHNSFWNLFRSTPFRDRDDQVTCSIQHGSIWPLCIVWTRQRQRAIRTAWCSGRPAWSPKPEAIVFSYASREKITLPRKTALVNTQPIAKVVETYSPDQGPIPRTRFNKVDQMSHVFQLKLTWWLLSDYLGSSKADQIISLICTRCDWHLDNRACVLR